MKFAIEEIPLFYFEMWDYFFFNFVDFATALQNVFYHTYHEITVSCCSNLSVFLSGTSHTF